MATTTCPECGAEVSFDETTVQGEIQPCPECGVELEVTKLEPLTVALAPEEEEDWVTLPKS